MIEFFLCFLVNFSAHKHVRSEKDRYSVQALIDNNDIKVKKLMDLLTVYPPKHFFCVSTDWLASSEMVGKSSSQNWGWSRC